MLSHSYSRFGLRQSPLLLFNFLRFLIGRGYIFLAVLLIIKSDTLLIFFNTSKRHVVNIVPSQSH